MADSAYIPGLASREPHAMDAPRHAAVVRITHWIGTFSFAGLVFSGFGILLAHPRFYWGETGGLGAPSILDLPLPFLLGGPSGWGRHMHFQSAWLGVVCGLVYFVYGFASGHFRKNLVPAKGERGSALSYNVVQRITYLAVIFGLFPLLVWTGLAMSPTLTSTYPALVTTLGGHQCARTIHFCAAVALALFVLVHVAMVWRAGFWQRTGAMITGHVAAGKESR
jgi:thiosulfate reductase cytochrome b subunit